LGSNGKLVVNFSPLNPADLSGLEGHELLQAVYEGLQSQLAGEHGYFAVERLAGAPKAAKNAWYVWWFIAEAGGSGIPGYLANHVMSTAELQAFRDALISIEAQECVTLLDAALALEEIAECLPNDSGSSWYEQFSINPSWAEWEPIERRSFELLSGPVSELAGAYIKRHAKALC
jgi:hypothetical protein